MSSVSNSIERKISLEEKRSVTNSNKGNSLNTSSQLHLNDSGKSASSGEQNHSKSEFREEDEIFETESEDDSRCNLM